MIVRHVDIKYGHIHSLITDMPRPLWLRLTIRSVANHDQTKQCCLCYGVDEISSSRNGHRWYAHDVSAGVSYEPRHCNTRIIGLLTGFNILLSIILLESYFYQKVDVLGYTDWRSPWRFISTLSFDSISLDTQHNGGMLEPRILAIPIDFKSP